jgi:EmrB/QacA subfamily drug resistance transporter
MQAYFRENATMATVSASSNRRWQGLVFISLSLLLISLANNIVNVALPSIAASLQASTSALQWIVDGYILTFAALLLTMGAVGDRFGRKRALMMALLMFAGGALAAALAHGPIVLIVVQMFLGAAGALIMPATLSLISATFTDPTERSTAISIWAAVFGLGLGIGPVLGGLVLAYFTWEAAFLIYVPVALIALVGVHHFVDESRDERKAPFDLRGTALSIAGLFLLVFSITEAGQRGLGDDRVLVLLGLAVALLAAFIWWETRAPYPMLPMSLFKNMSFTGANLALTVSMFSLFGCSFALTQYFQSVQDHSALQAGLRVLPVALVLMVTATQSGRISRRLGIKVTVAGGVSIVAVGFIYLAFIIGVHTSYPQLLIGFILLGIGMGLTQSPATDSVMGAVPVARAGVGSAMNDTTRELGGAMGVAVLGSIVNRTYLAQLSTAADTAEAKTLPQEAIRAIASGIQGAHKVAASLPDAKVASDLRTLADQAFVQGLDDALRLAAVLMILTAIIVFAILPAHIRRADSMES